MEKIKKVMFFTLMISFGLIMSVCIYAAPLKKPAKETVKFSVTGGIDLSKDQESSFDESRTISGEAENGTHIGISIYERNMSGSLTESEKYEVEVGISGLFSQNVNLDIGENVIIISAEKDGCTPVAVDAVIKRKSAEIKKELENGIAVPGVLNTKSSTVLFSIK